MNNIIFVFHLLWSAGGCHGDLFPVANPLLLVHLSCPETSLKHNTNTSHKHTYSDLLPCTRPLLWPRPPPPPRWSCGGAVVRALKAGISGGGRVSMGRPPLSGTLPMSTLLTEVTVLALTASLLVFSTVSMSLLVASTLATPTGAELFKR